MKSATFSTAIQRITWWTVGLLAGLTPPAFADKPAVLQTPLTRSAADWEVANQIWSWAELGFQEERSSALLADKLAAAGFQIERGVAGMPTAFIATIGHGSPVIGILGEYDALPGLAQAAVPVRQLPAPAAAPNPQSSPTSSNSSSAGHACGHHLLGTAAMSAAIALADPIRSGEIPSGTLRFYGCPAEEGGSGKVFLVRAGHFDDVDVVLHWHPSERNTIGDQSCLARIAVKFRFHGQSAHAAGSPDQGRSALDAVELTAHASELLREHTPDLTRIHHVITRGGEAPNVVPDFAEIFFYIRHPDAQIVRQLYPRLLKCAEAGALATETFLETQYLGGTVEILPNETLATVLGDNLTSLPRLSYTPEELEFATRLQATLAKPKPLDDLQKIVNVTGEVSKGSTDVGDVSWVVPTGGLTVSCFVPGTPSHSWQAVAAGGMSIGQRGLTHASQALAGALWDLFHSPDVLTAAKAEHTRRRGTRSYQSLLLPDQPPPLDYRGTSTTGLQP